MSLYLGDKLIAGTEPKSGDGTFEIQKNSSRPEVILRRTDIPSSLDASSGTQWMGAIRYGFSDATYAYVEAGKNKNNQNFVQIVATNDNSTYYNLSVRGDGVTNAPTPSSATDNSTKIATTAWVVNHRCTTKATTTSTASINAPAYIVQNYRNGTNWYRVWSDGWIEQGGKHFGAGNGTVINLVKNFIDTSYTLVTCAGNNTNTDKHEGYANPYNRTTTNFKIWWTIATSNCIDWYACGY
jgi:hypothetical protein